MRLPRTSRPYPTATGRVRRLARLRLVQRPAWLLAFLVTTALLLLAFAWGSVFWPPRPGSPLGLAYGILAVILLAAAALLAVRRRTVRWGVSRVQSWVQLHVYGGALFLLATFMHTGFSLPRSALGGWLVGLSTWVVMSGLAGVALRRWIPRVLTSGLSTEVLYERIPELAAVLRRRAESLVRRSPAPVRELYRRSLARHLAEPRFRWIFMIDGTGGIDHRLRDLDYLAERLPSTERAVLEELRSVLRAKLELDAHYSLQRPLRWWLYAHVPPSLALLFLVLVHLASVLYY